MLSCSTQGNLAVIKYQGVIRRHRTVLTIVGPKRLRPKSCGAPDLPQPARAPGSAWTVLREVADFHAASWLGSNKSKRGQRIVLHAKG